MRRKKRIIIELVLLLICSVALFGMYWISKDRKANVDPSKKTDAVRFAKEYSQVEEDNVFVYKSIDEIISTFKTGTGVAYLGFPECPWCQSYVKYLNKVAKEEGLGEIYYFNIWEDRKNNTEKYQEIVSILKDNLLLDKEGNPRVYVPDITVVVDGKIVGHDNETSVVTKEDGTPIEYWTEERVSKLEAKLRDMLRKVTSESCTSCNN